MVIGRMAIQARKRVGAMLCSRKEIRKTGIVARVLPARIDGVVDLMSYNLRSFFNLQAGWN
ncbi:MAG: hypothetical protein Q8904_03455 [Bacteroidota bacterium]|nr:hypothetical protein [Bacteroidota bacterium]